MDDAKVELVAQAMFERYNHATALELGNIRYGGTFDAWLPFANAAITALEASPNSRTEAITPEMIEAGRAVFDEDYGASGLQLAGITIDRMFLAMQAARPIDQQEAMPSDATKRMAKTMGCDFVPHSPVQDDEPLTVTNSKEKL